MDNPTIFFQSSIPRSGSTLLQNILAQNPNFYTSPTSGIAELIHTTTEGFANNIQFKHYQDYKAQKKAYYNFCKKGIIGYYQTLTSKPYILDKNRGWLSDYTLLQKIFFKPKIIVLVRDLRDVVVSFEKMYLKDPLIKYSWDDFKNIRYSTVIEDRFKLYCTTNPLYEYLISLYNIINSPFAQDICFVKFEDLCSNPIKTINFIYDYLNIPSFTHDFDNIKQITYENDNYQIFGEHTISPQLKQPQNNNLNIIPCHVADKVYNDYKWYFDYFNYLK